VAWRLPPSMNQIGAAEAAWRRRSESPRITILAYRLEGPTDCQPLRDDCLPKRFVGVL
jgi:hypothetical protein